MGSEGVDYISQFAQDINFMPVVPACNFLLSGKKGSVIKLYLENSELSSFCFVFVLL